MEGIGIAVHLIWVYAPGYDYLVKYFFGFFGVLLAVPLSAFLVAVFRKRFIEPHETNTPPPAAATLATTSPVDPLETNVIREDEKL